MKKAINRIFKSHEKYQEYILESKYLDNINSLETDNGTIEVERLLNGFIKIKLDNGKIDKKTRKYIYNVKLVYTLDGFLLPLIKGERDWHNILNDNMKNIIESINSLQEEMDIISRVPGKQNFFDMLEGSGRLTNMILDDSEIFTTEVVNSTNIKVTDTENLTFGEYAIYDDENIDIIDIIRIGNDEIVVKELNKEFKKGAIITKDSAVTDNGMHFKTFEKYDIKGSVI